MRSEMPASLIIGKDAPLEFSIVKMQTQLAELGFKVVEASWLNPIDHVWSVHLHDQECPLLYTNGKGASELAARASALGEFIERLSWHYFWSNFHLGLTRANLPFVHFPQERWFAPTADGRLPRGILNGELLAFYDPDNALTYPSLVDINSGNLQRGICTLPFIRLSDEEITWFPVNIIGNLYVSNGMAAGNTREEARTQALAEIIERHIKFRVIAEGLCLPDIPADVIERYPAIAAGIASLRTAGFGILVKDASLGGVYPVLNVTLLHPEDQGCFSSFGAHPRFEIALERALTELLQGRGLDGLGNFPEPSFNQAEVADYPNLEQHFIDSSGTVGWAFLSNQPDFEFVDWHFSNSIAADYQWLVDCIHNEGYQIYIADFTDVGVYTCRIIVPGMSEVYQVDDLEWENNSLGNALRPAISRLNQLTPAECSALLSRLLTMGLTEDRAIWEIIGLAADPDSAWKTLRVGELKTLLGLAIGDTEAVLEGCDWIYHFGQLPVARARVYRCIESLLRADNANHYLAPMAALYGAETLQLAQALLAGQVRFFGLNELGADFSGSQLHRQLLAAYDKLGVNPTPN
ncbi:YcaO-like family protein [Chitinibacter bivalviorum]|uniref:YcaO-like family protein n=1 Tax=Chitinibacter bivalviorum TaxID=2739434 RepID=A0A7H9BLT3_9NEIS|nr:30S ribosomal protein S12 methylthiotransferase accessory factor YcaO [Chitinibacter bivalviorum]QLG89553.1 YcaO-like family protein [Chitinibacter bivalviorum]